MEEERYPEMLRTFCKPPKLPIDNVSTNTLLQNLGYINQPSAGTIHWLPLGLKVLKNVETIIRDEMDRVGGEEFSLSSLSSRDLWQQTGRWKNTELFKMKINDGENDDFCLAPTHEEEITNLIKLANVNYKALPLLTYQITRKYRFEKRPRGGLLRGREFVMKDAYSFDKDHNGAIETFDRVNEAYYKIFSRLKVPFERAVADSGDIGGNLSQEWHFVNPVGEDLLYKCTHCSTVSNVEKTVALPLDDSPPAKVAKVQYALTHDNETLVAAYYPDDRVFLPNLLKDQVEDIDMSSLLLSPEEVVERFQGEGDEELILKKFIRIMDARLNDSTDLPDFPISTFQKNNFTLITDVPLVEAREGEICGECEEGTLTGMNAIEVGHTFYLGTRYSKPMNARYATAQNTSELLEMGCYGIGVSRIVGAIAQMNRDQQGLVWPSTIAPYQVALVVAPRVDSQTVDDALRLLSPWKVMQDQNEKTGFGAKIINAKMHGIPIVAVVGKNWPIVELEVRGKRWKPDNDETPYDYEIALQQKTEEWGWTCEVNNGVEKHFVQKDRIQDVISLLLKDL